MNSVEVRYRQINYDRILEKLKEYAMSKAASYGTRAIVLIGSLAKRTYTGTSDTDILIIADDIPHAFLERHTLFAEPNLPIDMEPIVYTSDEFIRMVHEGDRFAIETLKIGIPLYGEEFFNELRKFKY